MAKLTISEASRVAGVARSTPHRAIKQGRISLDPDGRLDTAELLRCGYTLQGVVQQTPATVRQHATPQQSGAPQVPISASELVIEALQRERDLLQQQLDATRELLQSERQATLERERATRDREALLLQMLHAAQQRTDRLLDLPRTSAPAGSPRPLPSDALPGHSAPQAMPDSWKEILIYMQAHPGPQRPKDIQRAFGRTQPARHVMHRMTTAGLLHRVSSGVYVLMEDQHHA